MITQTSPHRTIDAESLHTVNANDPRELLRDLEERRSTLTNKYESEDLINRERLLTDPANIVILNAIKGLAGYKIEEMQAELEIYNQKTAVGKFFSLKPYVPSSVNAAWVDLEDLMKLFPEVEKRDVYQRVKNLIECGALKDHTSENRFPGVIETFSLNEI